VSTSRGPCFNSPGAAAAADAAAADAAGAAAAAAAADAESADAVAVGAAADAEDADGVAAAVAAAAAWDGVCLGVDAGPGAEPSQRALRSLFVCGPDSCVAIRPLIHFGGRCGTLGPLDGGEAASPFGSAEYLAHGDNNI
jgi:hypothetical protein